MGSEGTESDRSRDLDEISVESLMQSDKGTIRDFIRWISEPSKVIALQEEITRLSQENLRLRTVMLAAHDEITEHWEAHCDSEGFGPQSLIRHLRDGTGYYAGMVKRITCRGSDETER